MAKLKLKEQINDDQLSLFINILESNNIDYGGLAYDSENLSIELENCSDAKLEESHKQFLKDLPNHSLVKKTKEIKLECKKRIEEKFPDWMQRSICLNVAIPDDKITPTQKKYKDLHPEFIKHSELLIGMSNKLEEKIKKLSSGQIEEFDPSDDKNWKS